MRESPADISRTNAIDQQPHFDTLLGLGGQPLHHLLPQSIVTENEELHVNVVLSGFDGREHGIEGRAALVIKLDAIARTLCAGRAGRARHDAGDHGEDQQSGVAARN